MIASTNGNVPLKMDRNCGASQHDDRPGAALAGPVAVIERVDTAQSHYPVRIASELYSPYGGDVVEKLYVGVFAGAPAMRDSYFLHPA